MDPQVGQSLDGPSVSAPNFVFETPSMGILFRILRRNEVSTLWSSFFLSFMCFANCILCILRFWANSHLPVSAYHVCSFVIGLPHSDQKFR
jgi:fucose permease